MTPADDLSLWARLRRWWRGEPDQRAGEGSNAADWLEEEESDAADAHGGDGDGGDGGGDGGGD